MKYQNIRYNELTKEMFEQLEKGAFLTTKAGDKVNTMTIAWGGINFVWHKPVFVAYVRYSRDTYDMLESSKDFTVNVPISANLKKELAYCGTKSGRSFNKIKDLGLQVTSSRVVETPILSDCELHFECNIIYKQAMEPGAILQEVKDKYYKTNDFHVVYYGEIVDSYVLKGE